MIYLHALNFCLSLLLATGLLNHEQPDPCKAAINSASIATVTAKDSVFNAALFAIKNTQADGIEHCISFGKDNTGKMISSVVTGGNAISGIVPAIYNAFADLHNHSNNLPPDAGDLYGLIDINKKQSDYKTRFVVTPSGTVYALIITHMEAAFAFNKEHNRQPPAFYGGPPGFPVYMVDEAREMKYLKNCSDEMVLAFILEKYNTGIALLKQGGDGIFRKLITIVSNNKGQPSFTAATCQ